MIICDMGMQRLYYDSGGFSKYLYHQVGETIIASNGIEGKIVEKIDKASYDGLPILSNTSEVYFKSNSNGEIIQARIYKDRKPVCDFDWDHNHTNKNGEKFEKGTIHVQPFKKDSKGNWKRDDKHARYLSNEEIDRYGELIRKANPNAKLKP